MDFRFEVLLLFSTRGPTTSNRRRGWKKDKSKEEAQIFSNYKINLERFVETHCVIHMLANMLTHRQKHA
jgi:hypothetical protein